MFTKIIAMLFAISFAISFAVACVGVPALDPVDPERGSPESGEGAAAGGGEGGAR